MTTPIATPEQTERSTTNGVGVLATGTRLLSLDVFRGVTIAGMILVNNPGTWSSIYPPLRHAVWHGWTPTDLIFPFFLFIVGVAVTVAYEKRLARGLDRGPLVRKAARRALVLFGLGLFMAAYPFVTWTPEWGLRDFSTLRIPGVLQRIALCYFGATLLFLYTRPRTQYLVAAGILFGYWAAMMLVPVPGFGAGRIDVPEASLAAYLDRLLLGDHLWAAAGRQWDPEGLLSTLPALVTTLLGVWTGRLLLSERAPVEKAVRLLAWGVLLVMGGYVWDWFFPVNKQIWTSSYVLLTGGQALCALGLCYWLIDVRGYTRWMQPFVVYGMNAITVFVLSGLLAKSLVSIRVTGEGGAPVSLQAYLYHQLFAGIGPPEFSSLLYALVWVVGWYLVLLGMYRKGIFIKV